MSYSSFLLSATAADFGRYFPTYLANGYFSVASSPQGTAPALSLLVGLMDRTPGDVSRPAALPDWASVDYSDGEAWLNAGPVGVETMQDYMQTLDMFGGTLTTRYVWAGSNRRTRVEVETFISQADHHLAATRLSLTPDFSGEVRLRFPLQAWPAPVQRLSLARHSWGELKDTLLRSPATEPLPPGTPRPAAPAEILTWFDLQQALAAEGRALVTPGLTAPTRAAVWYAGESDVRTIEANADARLLCLSGAAASGAGFSVAAAVEVPAGLALVSTRVERTTRGAALVIAAAVQAGRPLCFVKYASVSRDGWGDGPGEDAARVRAALAEGYAALLARHRRAWHGLWQADIVVEGDPQLQRVIHADMFYLLQNSTVDTAWAMAACGMSPNYYGHVFWDSDTWDLPALLLLHPERAKSLAMFRSRTLEEAQSIARRRGYAGAMFPWEADPERGDEQTPHFAGVNSQREIYLNGAIASSQWQYYLATGDRGWLRDHGFPIIRATADFWLSRVTHRPERDRYEILCVTSVDEKYTDVDNETFTNAVAQKNLLIATEAARMLGETADPRWAEVAAKMHLPFSESERRHLVFDESVAHDRRTWMAGSLTFLTYPSLDLSMSDDVRRNDYEYALRKNAELSPELNQMMVVMLAIHAAELGDAESALRWLRHEQALFLKPPFLVRSETPHNNATYILATTAGFLQNFLYGFTGLRLAGEGLAGKYAPVLPAAIKRLTLKGVACRGERLDVIVERDESGRPCLRRHPAAARIEPTQP